MKKVLGIYGAGGFGREVMALVPQSLASLFPNMNLSEIDLYFIDDEKNKLNIDGIDVLSRTEFLSLKSKEIFYALAIADCNSRKRVFELMSKSHAIPITLIFDNVLIMKDSKIGSGCIIMPGVKISTSVTIGEFVHVNFNSYIAHDCIIENFVTVSPGVICCGNTIVKNGAFIGAGSLIKQGNHEKPRIIGYGSVLGIGSNLLSDLPDNEVFVGNPAEKKTGK